jgi:hypothetical protein
VKHIVVGLCIGAVIGLLAPAAVAQGPKPGPEHDMLKQLEGTWEATVNASGSDTKGTMTWKMGLGGLWLVGDFRGESSGMKFQGKSLESYDPAKKKFVSLWVDSMSTAPMMMEGTYDKAKKTMTMTGEDTGHDGKKTKYKSVRQRKGEDTIVFTMCTLDNDGKEQPIATITYKRKK